MSVNNSTTSYFNGNSSISFRSIQSIFGGNVNTVRFSTYLRNTDLDSTNPIVPNATENASIVTTTSNLKASQFRGSIKYYILSQSGNDTTLDIDAQSWNSNLGKNVIKYFTVSGVMAATATSNTGGSFGAEAYNMKFSVGGYIYGVGGAGGSANGGNGYPGGDALQVSNNSNRGNASAKVQISIYSDGRIWGGGGGGGAGNMGASGPDLSCFIKQNKTYTVYSGGSTNPVRACAACPAPENSVGYGWKLHSNGDCSGQGAGRDRCRGRMERGQTCVGLYNRNCNYRYYYTVPGGNGGNGGNGGTGQGANTNQGGGNGGNAGNTTSCAANENYSIGSKGNAGASGGSWGSPGGNSAGNGGGAGRAIFGSGYNVTGANSNNVKGSY